MDLRYAQAFYVAASLLHFGKAAAELAIAPSALTRQIQLFEESVGESLFVRSNRKVVLTPTGREIFLRLSPFLSQKKLSSRKLRVGGLAGVIDNHFWPVAKKILGASEIQLEVHESTSLPAIENLLNGGLDLAFVNEKVSGDLIRYSRLGKEELVLVSKLKVPLTEIQNVPWIFCGRGSKLKSVSKAESVRQIKVSSIHKVLDLVELGLGVGVVPLSPKLSQRNFHVSALPLKNRETFLAVLKYKEMPEWLRRAVSEVLS